MPDVRPQSQPCGGVHLQEFPGSEANRWTLYTMMLVPPAGGPKQKTSNVVGGLFEKARTCVSRIRPGLAYVHPRPSKIGVTARPH